ncbi:MAG: hypothetical protein JWM11_4135 [Planctomycetaceae bacterium]|nr:hypothetical protein [Planctomycetaceae bacterium]
MPTQAKPRSLQTESPRTPRRWTWCVTGFACAALLIVSGCSRSFWRQNADKNSYAILKDMSADPRWSPNRLDLQPDPKSRFFDPYDPDCEPLPPDDPTAHVFMHWMGRNTGMARVDQPWTGGVLPPWLYPQKPIRGWKSWHKFGDTLTVENPQWLEPFGLTPEQLEEQRKAGFAPGPGIADLTLPQSIELAFIHSRDFQLQLESVYLAALTLTLQRFQFDVRYLGLGGQKPSAGLTDTEGAPPHTLQGNARAGISQLLPGGGQAIVELANNTLWLFTGGNQSSTASVLSYSIVQPLLLGAGRQVILESLTQAERNTLYQLRVFARFRQTFFVSIVNGTSGYLNLLEDYQGIRNTRFNILLLNKQLVRLRALSKETPEEIKIPLPDEYSDAEFRQKKFGGLDFPDLPETLDTKLRYDAASNSMALKGLFTEADLFALQKVTNNPDVQNRAAQLLVLSQAAKNTLSLEVNQLESTMLNNRITLLNRELAYQFDLDNYKFLLGLPPDLWISLNLKQLDQFELISPRLLAMEDDLTKYVEDASALSGNELVSKDLQTMTDRLLQLAKRSKVEALGLVESDLQRVQDNTPNRLARLPPTFDEQYRKQILIDYERDKRLIDIIRLDLNNEIKTLEDLKLLLIRRAKNLPAEKGAPLEDRADPAKILAKERERLLKLVQNLEVVQINLRVELIDLNAFNTTIEQAVQTGLENRVDLMNQRALVMDARRKIEVIANALRSQVNVTVQGSLNTVPLGAGSTAPFEFREDQSSYRMGLNFVAPLDQVAQRNNYRAALVTYQQVRRAYMQAEDQVKLNIRQEWRQLNVTQNQFELTRRSVRTAAMQYDQAVEAALAPAATGGGGGGGSSNTGLNIINALGNVLTAQNNLISIWVGYETNRLNIHSDMGIMQLDERGVWIDDYYQSQFGTTGSAQTSGLDVPIPAEMPIDLNSPPPLPSPDTPVPPAVPAKPE